MESRFKNWNYALFQPNLCPSVVHMFNVYTETAESENHNIDGVKRVVIFLGHQSAKDAALWLGWKDVTEKMQYLKEPVKEPEIKIVKPRPKAKAKARRKTKVS